MKTLIHLAVVVALGAACPSGAPSSTTQTTTQATSTAAPTPPSATATAAGSVALCVHKVPADLCTVCHPALAAVFRSQGDWCDEHGVPESHCLACNPGLTFGATAATTTDWCQEHGVPESRCTKCHPEQVAVSIAAGDYCREHGFPASVCPICDPDRPAKAGHKPPAFPPVGSRIRLASVATANDVAIATVKARRAAVATTIEVTGQLAFNGNAQAQVSAPHAARVVEVKVDVGDRVKAGQALVVLSSATTGQDRAQVAAATATLTAARAALARLEQLPGIRAQRELDDARRDVAVAEAGEAAALASVRASGGEMAAEGGGRLVLTTPLAGTAVARSVVSGRTVMAGDILVEVADTRTLWAELDVPEAHANAVREGQEVTIVLEGVRGPGRTGQVARVSARIDPRSRTMRARVDLDNADGALKAGQFLRATINVSDERESIIVPSSSVQRLQGRAIAFVVVGPGLYEPRAVSVEEGAPGSGVVEVQSGIADGDEVVTTGAFLLKTELMKDAIGAGCCE